MARFQTVQMNSRILVRDNVGNADRFHCIRFLPISFVTSSFRSASHVDPMSGPLCRSSC